MSANTTQTYKVDLGVGEAISGNPEKQRAYVSQKNQEINAENTKNTALAENPLVAKYAVRDTLLLKEKINAAQDYLTKNPTVNPTTIDKNIATFFAAAKNIRDGMPTRTFMAYLFIELKAFADSGTIPGYKLERGDKAAMLQVAKDANTFYMKYPDGTPGDYLERAVALTKTLADANPQLNNFIGGVLSDPFFTSVKVALSSNLQTQPIKLTADERQRVINYFVNTLILSAIFALFCLGGCLAANDAIWRGWAFRVINFIWGGIFFIVTIPYYLIYRQFIKKDPVKIYAALAPLMKHDLPLPAPLPEGEVEGGGGGFFGVIGARLYNFADFLFGYVNDEECKAYTARMKALWEKDSQAAAGSSAAPS